MSSEFAANDHSKCLLHEDFDVCFALENEYSRYICPNRPTRFHKGLLPVCDTHQQELIPSFLCQATEDCGRQCNRKARECPPFHLCARHDVGTDTLPCHLLSLPVELRLMIFRWLVPAVLSAEEKEDLSDWVALRKVNKQMDQEASMLLFGEGQFKALIRSDSVTFLGKGWARHPIGHSSGVCHQSESMDEVWSRDFVQKIRKLTLNLTISLSYESNDSIASRGIIASSFLVHETRDTVRKFTDLLSASPDGTPSRQCQLQHLVLSPEFRGGVNWDLEIMRTVFFLVLEPLQLLQTDQVTMEDPSVEHQQLNSNDKEFITALLSDPQYQISKTEFAESLQGASLATNEPPGRDSAKVVAAFEKLENVIRQLGEEDFVSHNRWVSSIHPDLGWLRHRGRVAYEAGDLSAFKTIQEVLLGTWNCILQVQIQRFDYTSRSVLGIPEDSTTQKAAGDKQTDFANSLFSEQSYEDAQFRKHLKAMTDQLSYDLLWNPRAVVTDMGLKVNVAVGDRTWILLKTPEVITSLRYHRRLVKVLARYL